MTVMIVDDERLMLKAMQNAVSQVLPDAEIILFQRAKAALEYAAEHSVSIAFLDIQMRGMNGTELAVGLQAIHPRINIIFCTAYDEYKGDAMELHASGYLTKPVQPEDIRRELALLRFPLETESNVPDKLCIRCFGSFQALYHGKQLLFSYLKTNELLAVLVDKNGAMCSLAMLEAILWEDDDNHLSYLKRLRSDLLATLKTHHLETAVIAQRGALGLNLDMIDCDYYDYRAGKPKAISAYHGAYMEQYSWAEETNALLYTETTLND